MMSRACSRPAITLFACISVLFACALPAQERDPGWEIFAPTEEAGERELTLDPEDDPGVPKPEFSLDELTKPRSDDPNVYIRYSAGKGEGGATVGEPAARVEPPSEKTRKKTRPQPVEESPALMQDKGMVSPITAERLSNLEAPIPIVNTRAEYRRAVANQEPEILFEGKRWVFSEETGGYVDPRAAALEEARRVQEAIRLQEEIRYYETAPPAVIPATGAYPVTVEPQPVPLNEVQPGEQYRVPGVVSGREDTGDEEGGSRRRRDRNAPVYGGSR